MVASFESAMTGTPSRLYIDAIEDSTIASIQMKNLNKAIGESGASRDHLNRFLISRLIYYMNLLTRHLFLITFEKRYLKLIQDNSGVSFKIAPAIYCIISGDHPGFIIPNQGQNKKQINNR